MTELASRWGPLAFLFPTNEPPKFGNDREAVTREAADRLAECFKKLVVRKVDRPLAQRFILQTLVALFAEDIGLLPRYLLGTLLDDFQTAARQLRSDRRALRGREHRPAQLGTRRS